MSISYRYDTNNFYQFRIILIGDSTVGKSSLLRQFVDGQFVQTPDPTVGVDFHVRTVELNNKSRVKLQLWDTAGQERFRAITRTYYRNCAGCLIVYDITCRESFEHVAEWFEESLPAREEQDIVYLLVGHKVDLEHERAVSTAEGEAFARLNNMLFIETSAKVLCNIEEAFLSVAREIHSRLEQGKLTQKGGWDGIKTIPFRPGSIYLQAPPTREQEEFRENNCKC